MKEYADFLAEYPPYDALEPEELSRLVRHLEVEWVTAGTFVVAEGSSPLTHIWVVRTGSLEVLDRGRVVDELGPGETFGHISVLAKIPPALAVRTAEDSLLYRIPDPRSVLAHPESLRFSFYGSSFGRPRLTGKDLLEAGSQPVTRLMRPVVQCPAAMSIREVSQLITQAHQSCAIIEAPQGLGIITDSDFRIMLAEGRHGPDSPVSEVMSWPAMSVDDDTSVTTAFLRMIEAGVHHLPVCRDQRPVGVIRVVDLASAEVRDPLVVRAAVENSRTLDELVAASQLLPSTAVELFDTGVPGIKIGALLAAVREAILVRLINLVDEEDADTSQPACSWMVLGSGARREPLPSSDLDTALVWENTSAPFNPAERLRARATRVLEGLERCGLQPCPDGANANNPLFSRSVSSWRAAAAGWVQKPNTDGALLLASMLADSRPITDLPLGRSVIESMLKMARPEAYLRLMLQYTLSAKPPIGFVRGLVVEHSGEHRGRLDLKRGGLLPVASIGRWVAVVTGNDRGSTADRLRRGATEGVLTVDESETLLGTFELVYGLLLSRDIDAIRSGKPSSTYVAPTELDTLTRRYLREAFREVARVQARLESEWVSRL